MNGAVIGGVAALLGFGGLWAYLLYVNGRIRRALTELSATAHEAAPPQVQVSELVETPAVTVTELEGADGTQ